MSGSCSTLVLLVTLRMVASDLFTEDGVFIQEQGPARIVEAVWTTLVVIHPPSEIPMRAWVRQVEEGIQAVGPHVSAADQQVWAARLQALVRQRAQTTGIVNERLARSAPARHKRMKRGILDVVGDAAKYLFGVATSQDVKELKRAVRQAAKTKEIIFHRTEKMVSVINQTRRYVRENRHDIQDLQRHQTELQNQLRNYGDHLNELGKNVNRLLIARSVDNTIGQLELVNDAQLRQVAAFMQQKHELERGWLTENTFNPRDLNVILKKIRHSGYITPISEWYYENLHVQPLWTEGEGLVYRVDIPAAGRTHYLQYELSYFPVPINDNYVRTFQGLKSVAVNTDTGSVFYPDDCIGVNPRLCLPSKEVLSPTCEYGLISNNSLNACKIVISKRNSSSDIFPLKLGTFVITPFEKLTVTMRCQGQSASAQVLTKPTQINVPGKCKLETSEWRISGTQREAVEITKTIPRIGFNRTVNFTLPSEFKVESLGPLKYQERIEIPLVDLPDFQERITSYNLRKEPGNTVATYMSLVPFVILVVVINIFVLRRFLKKRAGAKDIEVREPAKAAETQELTTLVTALT